MTGLDDRQTQQQWRQGNQALWYSGVLDVVLGIAGFLWGDFLIPSETPIVFDLTLGKFIGVVLLGLAAPMTFALYYFRRRQEAEKWPVARGPVEKL